MTSVLAAQSLKLPTDPVMTPMDAPTTAQAHDSALQRAPAAAAEAKSRGRARSRQEKDEEAPVEVSPGEGADEHSSGTEGPSRKRRRSRKGLDKKFVCPQDGCGKSYSRAEHL